MELNISSSKITSINYQNKHRPFHMGISHRLECWPHLHKELELVYVCEGESIAYLGSEKYLLKTGDLFLSFPNTVHYYKSFTQEASVLMIFSPDFIPDFSGILKNQLPTSPVLKAEVIPEYVKDIFLSMNNIYRGEKQYNLEICKGYLTVCLAELLPMFSYCNTLSKNTDMIASILTFCQTHYSENISLDILAENLHISKYYISKLFNEKIKIGFSDYINALRVNSAKELLRNTDSSVTDISIQTGFNTIRSFNRAFLELTGMQPRQYRRIKTTRMHSPIINKKHLTQKKDIKLK